MKRLFYAVLVGLICAVPVDAADKHKPSTQPGWNLKYKSSSFQLKEEQWLKGMFVANVTTEKRNNSIIIISADQVRAIYYDPKAQKDSDLIQQTPRSGCGYAKSLMPKSDSAPGPAFFLAWIEPPGPIPRAAERLNARYLVRFSWSDGSSKRDLVLSVSYCEYASFLANVRWFAAQRWPDVGREFPKVRLP